MVKHNLLLYVKVVLETVLHSTNNLTFKTRYYLNEYSTTINKFNDKISLFYALC